MRTVRSGAGRVLACVVAIVLGWQAAAWAATPPPSISDIVGSYVVKYSAVHYYFADGIPLKNRATATWDISYVSPTEVEIYIPAWNDTCYAYYDNGILLWGYGDSVNVPSQDGEVGYALLSGTAGKVKLKGTAGYSALYDGWCEMANFSGKMYYKGKSLDAAADEAEDDALDDGAKATAPPSIDDLVGFYAGTIKGVRYQPSTGEGGKGGQNITFTIAKIDDYTLSIDTGDDLLTAYYDHGVVMVDDLDDADLSANASFMLAIAKGTSGKVSIKGRYVTYMNIGGLDDELEAATLTAKQVATP